MQNKLYSLLQKILEQGKTQQNKKGGTTYLTNELFTLLPGDILQIFEDYPIAKKKLKAELGLYLKGETSVDEYRAVGVQWWDYCWPNLINSYPTYIKELPALIENINSDKSSSKNYVLFLGETNVETNQLPCISLIQFQIEDGELILTAYQRSSDANLGLPADIYHLYLISRMIDLPLKSITFCFGSVHIYDNNHDLTQELLQGHTVKFNLNT